MSILCAGSTIAGIRQYLGAVEARVAKAKASADRPALDVPPIMLEIRSTERTSFGEISAEIEQ